MAQIGLELGIGNCVLRQIEINYCQDVYTCCRRMFNHWMDTMSVSWSQLLTALREIGLDFAAEVIEKQLRWRDTGSDYVLNTRNIKLIT